MFLNWECFFFFFQYIDDRPGLFIDLDTKEVVGEHNGLHCYTVGQGCKFQTGGHIFKYFIAEKDFKSGNIFVVAGMNHPALYSSIVFTKSVHWIDKPPRELYRKGQVCFFFKFFLRILKNWNEKFLKVCFISFKNKLLF